ncbi:hypothetical protein LOK49_LG02G02684 [Camellia lanceoleosa]|uniref:Uncharacterized protein n=1 Tax=Camellia lanceoleosa TaxID=1840588 RepID=A0ACC0IRG3_9ERIC|nr:hypothetical protein LOK49_LG02G02684 [Camellia lanceoleosa]
MMISEAISSLKYRPNDPTDQKFMEEKYSSLLPPNFKKMLSIQLKKFVKSEKLVKDQKLVAAAAASIKESEKTYKAVVKNGEKTKN